MKYNVTLYDYLRSEFINNGLNEFRNKQQITFYSDKYSFIKKIINYDEDTEKIVNERLFGNITLSTPAYDKKFKRQFVNRFLHYQPNSETVEVFQANIINVFLNNIDLLNEYYKNIDLYISGTTTSNAKERHKNISDNRSADSTLPQTQVNINVDDTILNYADTNMINRNKENGERETDSINKNYDINNLEKSKGILNMVFDEFEKNCFMFIW